MPQERSPGGLKQYLKSVQDRDGIVQIADLDHYLKHTEPSTDRETEFKTWQYAFRWADRKLHHAHESVRMTEGLIESLRGFQSKITEQMTSLLKPSISPTLTVSDSRSEAVGGTQEKKLENIPNYSWRVPRTAYSKGGHSAVSLVELARERGAAISGRVL
jgi:hypothetical protein